MNNYYLITYKKDFLPDLFIKYRNITVDIINNFYYKLYTKTTSIYKQYIHYTYKIPFNSFNQYFEKERYIQFHYVKEPVSTYKRVFTYKLSSNKPVLNCNIKYKYIAFKRNSNNV